MKYSESLYYEINFSLCYDGIGFTKEKKWKKSTCIFYIKQIINIILQIC